MASAVPAAGRGLTLALQRRARRPRPAFQRPGRDAKGRAQFAGFDGRSPFAIAGDGHSIYPRRQARSGSPDLGAGRHQRRAAPPSVGGRPGAPPPPPLPPPPPPPPPPPH